MKYLKRNKIILIPYPAQGHVTPMIKLASVLAKDFDLDPVVVMPEFIYRRIWPQIDVKDGISCVSIPDGLEADEPRDFFSIEKAMEDCMPYHLEQVVGKLVKGDGEGGTLCFIVDLLASWAINVGNKFEVQVAGFWPAMHTTYRLIASIPHMLSSGIISENGCPLLPKSPIFVYPGQPRLTTDDIPWLIGSSASRISRFKFWKRTLDRSNTLNCLLINTFPHEFIPPKHYFLSSGCPSVLEIGPLNAHSTSTSKINPSFRQEDKSCLDWLNSQSVGSVVYISFGSWVSPIEKQKVHNLAMALEASRRPFLWVLGSTWRQGLPMGYAERMSRRGRIVSWAPQMEVLRHKAVGCYLTHCGWNSIVEAIECKKPLLCYPVAGDQFVNCAYVVDAWRVGVKIKGFERRELEGGFERVMGDYEIRQRLVSIHEKLFGKEARSKVATNLTNFVQDTNKVSFT